MQTIKLQLCIKEFHKIILPILGENMKNKKEDGTFIYKLGVIYFESCTWDKTKFKKMESWWLADIVDVVHHIDPPVVEKISGKHVLYSFNLEPQKDGKKGKDIKGTKDAKDA